MNHQIDKDSSSEMKCKECSAIEAKEADKLKKELCQRRSQWSQEKVDLRSDLMWALEIISDDKGMLPFGKAEKFEEIYSKHFGESSENHLSVSSSLSAHCYDSWQAACEYKQKEIDKFKEQNKKLRECVEFYADYRNHGHPSDQEANDETAWRFLKSGKRARQALKETGE